ncbi:MAG: hypothetical protein ABI317_02065 [Gaiellales bacterium]
MIGEYPSTCCDARLDRDERGEQQHGGRERRERLQRGPALGRRAHDAEDRDDETCRHRQGAERVEVAARDRRVAQGGGIGQEAASRLEGDQRADRDVHEEDPAPVERVGEHTADDRPGAAAGSGHGAPHTERSLSLGTVAERRHENGEDARRHDRTAHALDRPRGDEKAGRRGERAGERREREHDDAGDEHPLPAEQIARTPAEQQEAAEGDGVGVHHPLQSADREAEVIADRGQRDVDDRHVEQHHELRGADEGEDHSVPTGVGLPTRLHAG